MVGSRKLGACSVALLLSCVVPATAGESERARPDGLDGLAVLQSPLPAPLDYFDTRKKATELVASEKFAEAEPLVARLANAYPFDGHNWLLMGRVERNLGKYGEAANAYRKAIALLGPGVPGRAGYWLAVSEAAGGSEESALDTLGHLVAEDHYVERPSLYSDDSFKSLKGNPRFAQIAGHVDSASWSREEGWRRDIDYLVAEVKRVNPDYHDRPLPPEFERSFRALRVAVTSLSDEQIYAGMSRMLATLNQGHTNLWPFIPATKIAFKSLPVQFYVFPEGVFIVAAPGNEDLVGAQLIQIENTPAMEVLRRIRDIHAADSGMEILWLGPLDLSLAQELVGLGIAPRVDRIRITVSLPSGATLSRSLMTTSVGGVKLPAPPGTPPLAFSHLDKNHWLQTMPDVHALYVQVNQIADDPDETLEAFGLRLRVVLKDEKIRNIILDLRNNNGGNTFTYVELLRTLIGFSTQDGCTLYVLIGRGVYSAAANLATDLERLASPIFVGEPTSMTGNNYGDESALVLPYSGIWAGLPGVKWQLGYPYDARRSIVPQVPVATTAADYFAGRDPPLETARALSLRNDRSRTQAQR